MNSAVEQMIARYNCRTEDDFLMAFREIVQSIVLQGLSRNKFFERAAFYGGTALRIFYGLNRASEDMDFSLLKPDPSFRIAPFGSGLRAELESYGIRARWSSKEKTAASTIDSAFLKMDTQTELLEIGMPARLAERMPTRRQLKIKLEIDIDPPPGFLTEVKTRLAPSPHAVRIYKLPDLLAGKLHAVLFRGWKNRVKGRDWYDLVWYAGHAPEVNLDHLNERIRQSEQGKETEPAAESGRLTADSLKQRLRTAVDRLEIAAAQKDVRPFLRDPREIELWSKPFFYEVIDALQPAGPRAAAGD